MSVTYTQKDIEKIAQLIAKSHPEDIIKIRQTIEKLPNAKEIISAVSKELVKIMRTMVENEAESSFVDDIEQELDVQLEESFAPEKAAVEELTQTLAQQIQQQQLSKTIAAQVAQKQVDYEIQEDEQAFLDWEAYIIEDLNEEDYEEDCDGYCEDCDCEVETVYELDEEEEEAEVVAEELAQLLKEQLDGFVGRKYFEEEEENDEVLTQLELEKAAQKVLDKITDYLVDFYSQTNDTLILSERQIQNMEFIFKTKFANNSRGLNVAYKDVYTAYIITGLVTELIQKGYALGFALDNKKTFPVLVKR